MSIDESRRKFLQTSGLGIGWLAALDLLQRTASAGPANPLAAKTPPLPATAKRVISLFMQGGPSQVDTFDPKPLLAEIAWPASAGQASATKSFRTANYKESVILGSKWTFKKHGQSGVEISDLFPHIAQQADDMAVIRSCYHDGFTHSQAQFLINNGWPRIGRPSLGSWILYGLGQREPEFAGIRRDAGRRCQVRPGSLWSRVPARGVSRDVFPPGPQSDSESESAGGNEDGEQRELLDTAQ